jgi:hypothetical protein
VVIVAGTTAVVTEAIEAGVIGIAVVADATGTVIVIATRMSRANRSRFPAETGARPPRASTRSSTNWVAEHGDK